MKILHNNCHKTRHKQLSINNLHQTTKLLTHYKNYHIYYLKTLGKLFSSKKYLIKY